MITSDQTPLQWPGPRLLVHLCCTVHSLKLALAASLKPHRPAEGGQYTMEQVPNFPSQTCSTGSLPSATWWRAPHSGGQDRPPLLVHPLHYSTTTGSPWWALVYSTGGAGTQNQHWAVGKVAAAKSCTIQFEP